MDDEDNLARNPGGFSPPEENFEPGPGQMELPGKELRPKTPRFKTDKTRLIKKLIWLALILLATALIASAGYLGWRYFDGRGGGSEQSGAVGQPAEVGQSPLTETYTSDELNLDFKYPQAWSVSEGAGGIRVESPGFTYATVDGSSAQGYFRVYIRQGARETDSKYIGRGKATQPSERLIYTDPVAGQRKDTYLSVFGLDSEDSFNFFLVQGNFKLKKGDTLGPDFGKEADAYIIAGGYSSKDNSEDLQMNSLPADSYSDNNAYKQAVEIIKTLQLR